MNSSPIDDAAPTDDATHETALVRSAHVDTLVQSVRVDTPPPTGNGGDPVE